MRLLALVTAGLGFLLVIAGGLVTSTGSGLAVPDWPLSYGTLFPPMVGGIRFEHSHRMIASGVGLLTLVLTLWVLVKEERRWVRRLALGAFGLVVLQGILGGLTVLWHLPSAISILHACLGQTFFAALLILATVLSPQWIIREGLRLAPTSPSPAPLRLCLATLAALVVQLILGATMRHVGWLPLLVAAHILGAVAVFLSIGWTAGRLLRQCRLDPFFRRPAHHLTWLLVLQAGLGIATLVRGADAATATAHVAVGALLLGTAAVLTARVFRFLSPFSLDRSSKKAANRPLSVYLELTKPRLTGMALMTAVIGFFLRSPGPLEWGRFCALLMGTALVGGGAGALNQVLEQGPDSRMRRTRSRPIPSGRITPESALLFGVLLSAAGLLILALGTPPLCGFLATATVGLYLFVYTPLKGISPLCTLVGAIPGAIPPLIGWAAARGELGIEAGILFGILFLWQLPHFLAIAWMHRADYSDAGFKMLPVLDPEGGITGRQIILYCLALVPVSLLPAAFGLAGWIYFLGALGSSLAFLTLGVMTARLRTLHAAKQLFFASLLYLPSIGLAMTLDRVIL